MGGAGMAPALEAGEGETIYNSLRSQDQSAGSSSTVLPEKGFVSKADDWEMMREVKLNQERGERDNLKGRKLGLTWNNLNVRGVGAIQHSWKNHRRPPQAAFENHIGG